MGATLNQIGLAACTQGELAQELVLRSGVLGCQPL